MRQMNAAAPAKRDNRKPGHGRGPLTWMLCLAACLATAEVSADWVTLRSGETIRGVGLEQLRKGGDYTFTREDGVTVRIARDDLFLHEKSPAKELVEFRGRKVSLRKKVRELQKERQKRLERGVADLERWAAGLREVDRERQRREEASEAASEAAEPELARSALEAAERLRSLESSERERILIAALKRAETPGARRLAGRELGAFPTESAFRQLARRALLDEYRSVRDTALRQLLEHERRRREKFGSDAAARQAGQATEPKDTPLETSIDVFIDALASKRPHVRTRAANALSLVPRRRAVAPLIDTFYMTWTGFGRGYTMQATQRAFIKDYELVSGGTGFSIIEVADPVVATNTTGVALDVKVRRVEVYARVRALRKATGQNFGSNLKEWRAWAEENDLAQR